jgi:hypothetical protein
MKHVVYVLFNQRNTNATLIDIMLELTEVVVLVARHQSCVPSAMVSTSSSVIVRNKFNVVFRRDFDLNRRF